MTTLAMHLSKSDDHGTPPEFLAIERAVFGGPPDVDPASSSKWNRVIGARHVITASQGLWRTPWFIGACAPEELRTKGSRPASHLDEPGTLHLNPPGDKRGLLVARSWWAAARYLSLGWITCGVWVGFSLQQLSRLQRIGADSHPLQHPTMITAERHDYLDGETGKLQEQTPGASFLTLLGGTSRQRELFAHLAGKLGHVVNGDLR